MSPESVGIFDLLLGVFEYFVGDLEKAVVECGVAKEDVEGFLDYGARFFSNLGNYYVGARTPYMLMANTDAT